MASSAPTRRRTPRRECTWGRTGVPRGLSLGQSVAQPCLRDRAAGRDPNATPPTCTTPAIAALDPAALRAAQPLATQRNYAAAFVNALAWVLASLTLAVALVLLLPAVRTAALD